MLARSDEHLLNAARPRWHAPLLAGLIAVLLDLFIDPIAVPAGYWVWIAPANVDDEIPLLNFVGWLVLMVLAPLAWIEIARRAAWSRTRMLLAASPLFPTALRRPLALSLLLNGAIGMAGLQ